MNSPSAESMSSSSSDGGSTPPPEESRERGFVERMGDNITSVVSFATSGSAKRRNFGGGTVSRDPKSRRREETGRRMGFMGFEGREQLPRSKDELVDLQVVDQLRAQFGDPFDDREMNNAS